VRNDKLYNYLLKLPHENLVNLLLVALDEMQVCNSRSVTQCIAIAVGATEVEDGKWVFPEIEEVIKRTEHCPL